MLKMLDENLKEILSKAKELGWKIVNHHDFIFEFCKVSPCGLDFCFWVDTENDMDIFLGSLKEFYDNFDISSVAYSFLDKSGHGFNGAPYDMLDVYNDIKTCHDNVKKLCDELTNIVLLKEKEDKNEFYQSLNIRSRRKPYVKPSVDIYNLQV